MKCEVVYDVEYEEARGWERSATFETLHAAKEEAEYLSQFYKNVRVNAAFVIFDMELGRECSAYILARNSETTIDLNNVLERIDLE